MYKVLLVIFISMMSNIFAADTPLLKKNRQEILEQKKKEIEAGAKRSKYDWIAPLSLSASYSQRDDDDLITDTSIALDQDLFRSGGIFYQIEYADARLQNSLTSLAQQESSLYEGLYIGLLGLQRLRLILEQTHHTLLNYEIEVFLKTQQYKTGDVDITELNRALRERNAALKRELTARQSIVESEIELKISTDIELENITVPTFRSILKDTYEKTDYDLLIADLSAKESDKEYKIARSSYLPTISLNAAYGHQDDPNLDLDDDYYQVGVTLSMPLDYNTDATLQESKAYSMRKRLEIQDIRTEELSLYDEGISKIKNYEEHIKVTKENIRLYTRLIDIVQKALKSGLKTGYDLKTLKNTKLVDELELEINEIDIQIELARLLFATKKGEEYYGSDKQ